MVFLPLLNETVNLIVKVIAKSVDMVYGKNPVGSAVTQLLVIQRILLIQS